MSNDGFVFIDIDVGGPSNTDIKNLTKIQCPCCKKEYLKVSKFDSSKLLCCDFEQCCYETTVEQLKKEEKYIPQDMGTAFSNKPFLSQTNANRNYIGGGNGPGAYIVDTESDWEKVQKYKLTNMHKDSNQPFTSLNNRSGKKVDQKTLDVIKKVANSDTAQIVDVSLY